MTGFTHPRLKCWLCCHHPASQVVEAKALSPHATHLDFEVETHYRLCCDDLHCLKLSGWWAAARDSVHMDTYPLSSREEAEAITGLDLSEAAR